MLLPHYEIMTHAVHFSLGLREILLNDYRGHFLHGNWGIVSKNVSNCVFLLFCLFAELSLVAHVSLPEVGRDWIKRERALKLEIWVQRKRQWIFYMKLFSGFWWNWRIRILWNFIVWFWWNLKLQYFTIFLTCLMREPKNFQNWQEQ